MILLTPSILSLLYYILIINYARTSKKTAFSEIWLLLSAAFLFLFCVINYVPSLSTFWKNSPILKHSTFFLLFIGIASFILIQIYIISHMFPRPHANLDYIIVLGAHVNGTVPSRALSSRIDTAYKYLIQYPHTKVILSGGQGNGEDISEAQAMKQTLQKKGIPLSQMILEEQSTNTLENLTFSFTKITTKKVTLGIVTSNFHIFRAICLAKHLGYHHITALAAPVDTTILPHYMMREYFAILKEKLVRNI